MKRHYGICSPMESSPSCAKKILFMVYLIGLVVSDNLVKSYPSWDTQTTITDFGRNIRQLPCVSRRTGDTGICMFAYSCAKVNGTHLGTCIDRFYFGSCCKTPGGDAEFEVNEPDNYLNNLDNDVVGPPITPNVKPSPQPTSTDKYGTPTNSPPILTSFPSSTLQTYKPTTKFTVSSTTPSSSTTPTTSRTQYTEISTSNGTRPTFTSGATSSISSAYSTTVAQSTRPAATTTFSTVKPQVKPSSFKPPVRDPVVTTVQKPKPQTVKPTVQFSVPSSTTASSNGPHSSSQETAKPAATAPSPYTTMTSLRPLNTTVAATFATTKPAVKPPSTTYKTTAAAPAPTTASPQKIKPQSPKPTAKPKPSSVKTDPTTAFESVTTSYATRLPVDSVAETIAMSTAPTTIAQNNQNQTSSYGSTTVTSTSPTLVTWTTLDKVPVIPSENTKPPPSITYKPPTIEVSTLPSWVKLPVETHEPNAPGAQINESNTNEYLTTLMTSKPTTIPSPSDNDIIMTSQNLNTNVSSTQSPPSTPSPSLSTSAMLVQTTTDSNEAGNAPLNMSNYKDVCGRRLFPTARIVGGEKVSFGKWPWQISLRQWRTSTYLHKCGAALFNENWAVTAAHCVENVPPSDLLLRLGEHDLSVEEEPYGYEERRIQIVASHPQFDPRTFEYDLALLRFYEPVKFQPNIIPVCVPEDDSIFVGSSAYVTGWGRLYEDGPLPSVLQEVTVPVINNSVCETMYRAAGYIEHIPDIFICAGWKKGGFDSCEGDSGGPMVIQRPDKRWLLAGIISWGIGCAEPNQPGVYTRISKFKDWINQILQF